MKKTMVIPTYWSRPSDQPWVEGDAVYDHATPIDQDGTLVRMLESLKILGDRDFDLVVLGCATAADIEDAVEERIHAVLRNAPQPVHTYLVTHSHLRAFHKILAERDHGHLAPLLSLRGYPEVRNMCLFVPYVMGSDVAILIDDDEVFEDPDFISKAAEFIDRRFLGKSIDGVAGYYLNEDGNYYDKVTKEPWMTYWDRFGCKSEAFDKIIGREPRLKVTPFAFGGCMIIHRNMFKHVPFDPAVTRGEDTDYVLNARMFGFSFFLDNKLNIKHLPPPKKHPIWMRLREDIHRLLYDRAKIEMQRELPNMTLVAPEDFDPYPGAFLKEDLDDKILKTNLILALDYLANNDAQACKEAIRNIWIAKNDAIPDRNVFEAYVQFQKRWRGVIRFAHEHRSDFMEIVAGTDALEELLEELQESEKSDTVRDSADALSPAALDTLEFFRHIKGPGRKLLIEHMALESYEKGKQVIRDGGDDFTLYVVRSGRLRVSKSKDGVDVTIAIVKRGEHVGEVGMLTGLPATTDVIAEEDTLLFVLSRRHFEEVMDVHPETGTELLRFLARKMGMRLRATSQRYVTNKAKEDDVSESV